MAGNFAALGRNMLIVWKPYREAASAVNDAWPTVAKANKVTLVAFSQKTDDGESRACATRIAEHLALLGVKATIEYQHTLHGGRHCHAELCWRLAAGLIVRGATAIHAFASSRSGETSR